MKKIISILILFILFISHNVYAYEVYEFRWTNTIVNVERNDDLSKYTSIPTAKLYRNGVVLNDAFIKYNINGDWLYYLRDVDTTKLGEYKVWYKAEEVKYNPGTCNNYKALITFNVIDTHTLLDINILGNYDDNLKANVLSISISKDKIDYLKNGLIKINYKYDYQYNIDDSKVNYQKPGLYEAYIHVIDDRNITYNKKFYVSVCDNNSPIIIKKKDVIIKERSKDINWNDYIHIEDTILDTYKISVIRLDESLLDVKQEGIFTVTDSANNCTEFKYDVIVKDTILPVITLKEVSITLDYGIKYTVDDFKEYLDKALDGELDISNRVEININDLSSSVGDYGVIFSVIDDDKNYAEEILIVSIRSKKLPTITCKDVNIKVNEEVDFYDYITVVDESDPNIMDSITIDSLDFDNTKEGIYYVKVIVKNSSGNTNHDIIKVTVTPNSTDIPIIKIVSIVLLSILIIGGFIYYKKHKSNDVDVPLDM